MLYNVDTTSVPDVEKTLNQRCTISIQSFFNVVQRRFNVDMTLSQRCFNVASTSIKAISKPIWLMKLRGLFRTQISKMKLFEKRVNGFQQKAPSQMFEQVLNTSLTMVTDTDA